MRWRRYIDFKLDFDLLSWVAFVEGKIQLIGDGVILDERLADTPIHLTLGAHL